MSKSAELYRMATDEHLPIWLKVKRPSRTRGL